MDGVRERAWRSLPTEGFFVGLEEREKLGHGYGLLFQEGGRGLEGFGVIYRRREARR